MQDAYAASHAVGYARSEESLLCQMSSRQITRVTNVRGAVVHRPRNAVVPVDLNPPRAGRRLLVMHQPLRAIGHGLLRLALQVYVTPTLTPFSLHWHEI